MANTIRLKRSSLAGKVPTAADLALGEIAVNTTDGKLYLKKSDGGEFIVEVGPVVSVAGRTGAVTLAKADVGLSNADNTSDATKPISTAAQAALDGKAAAVHGHAIADVTGLQTALDAKAPLASPALTGTPTAPTQTQGNNSTRLATTAYVDTLGATKAASSHTHAISEVTSLQTSLDAKAPLASPALTGTPTAPSAAAYAELRADRHDGAGLRHRDDGSGERPDRYDLHTRTGRCRAHGDPQQRGGDHPHHPHECNRRLSRRDPHRHSPVRGRPGDGRRVCYHPLGRQQAEARGAVFRGDAVEARDE